MIIQATELIATAALVAAVIIREGYCARTAQAADAQAAHTSAAPTSAAACAAARAAQHLTRSDIWRARVDRTIAPPQMVDHSAAMAYLEAAAQYHRVSMRRSPSEPIAFTAAADSISTGDR